ncbi:hypothetical protein VTJ04DRAFT_10482 [Mycothermus thermophilus]|uniref:uncharacterized protein n=1 Tax=Humicola insolens TaxID=85995 RepID=UPI003743FA3C
MLFMWTKCRPVEKIWDDTVEGWCVDPNKIVVLFQWSAGWSGCADVLLAMVPWTVILGARQTLNIKERIGVAIAMSMGVVASIASFVKMAMLPNLTGSAVDSVSVTIWGCAEGAITIMAASVPVLRILFQKGNNSTQTKLAMNTERSLNNATSLETLSTRTNDAAKVDGYRENSRLSIAESHNQIIARTNQFA